MNAEPRRDPWTDPIFVENQRKFSAEQLRQYSGKHIAWSWDGSQIVAAANDRRSLHENLRAAEIDPLHVIHDFVEDSNLSYLA